MEIIEPTLRPSALTPALRGLALAARRWPVLLALWLAAGLTALPFAMLPGESLLSLMNRPVIAQMADGLDSWQWLDLTSLMRMQAQAGLPDDLQQGLLGAGLAALLLLPLGGLFSAFLYGGALISYQESDRPFDLRRFAWGCWHWFAGFSLLAMVQFLATLILMGPVVVIGFNLATSIGAWGWLVAALVAGLLGVWLVIFEQARVLCVAAGTRNPFRGIGEALTCLLRRPLPWLMIYTLSLLALAAVHFVFRLGLLPAAAPFWPLVIVVQQGFIALRLFLRAARLAGGMVVARG